MQRNRTLLTMGRLALGFAGLALGGRPAMASPPPSGDLIGSWRGFFQSALDPRNRGLVRLDIVQATGNQFAGRLQMQDRVVLFHGSLADDGRFRVESPEEAGGPRFVVHGKVTTLQPPPDPERTQPPPDPDRTLSAWAAYRFVAPPEPDRGSTPPPEPDRGSVLLLKSMDWGDSGPVLVPPGPCDGLFLSDTGQIGATRAQFFHQNRSEFDGLLRLGHWSGKVVGTLAATSDTAGSHAFYLVGVPADPTAGAPFVRIRARYLPAVQRDGTFLIEGDFAFLDAEGHLLDRGTFFLTGLR
jgi:hypothetical protein